MKNLCPRTNDRGISLDRPGDRFYSINRKFPNEKWLLVFHQLFQAPSAHRDSDFAANSAHDLRTEESYFDTCKKTDLFRNWNEKKTNHDKKM